MLYKSRINLNTSIVNYIKECKTITLFSAYIKLKELQKINETKKIKQIVVRWEIKDLCLGVSDFEEIYDYCVENKIALYRNTQIHLKAFWDNNQSVLFGSANVTGRGIGEKGNFNWELNGLETDMSFEDSLYLQNIIHESEYVDKVLFEQLKNKVSSVKLPAIEFPEIPTQKKEVDYFLISQLPMTSSPEFLIDFYLNKKNIMQENVQFIIHDLCIYNIPLGLDDSEISNILREQINKHPFIIALKRRIIADKRQSLGYGQVIDWIQRNTTTVPTPGNIEMKDKKIVNNLYKWICYADSDYTWDTPNVSDIIYYKNPN